MSIGLKIKELRQEFNITQSDLGNKINVVKSTISQYENNINTPDINTLKKIADYFNVSIDYLLERSNNKNVLEETDNCEPIKTECLKQFGKRLKQLRIEKNMTQKELADKFVTSKSSISMYEQNRQSPDIDVLIAFARFFEVSVDYLIGFSNVRKLVNDTSKLGKDEDIIIKYFRKLNERNRIKLEVKAEMLLEQQNLENLEKVNNTTFTYSNQKNNDSVILISEDEKEYLDYYRSLSPEEQEQLDKNMQKIIDKAWKNKGNTG